MSNKKKNSTIYDIAECLGINSATLSRVLNSPEKANPKTRSVVSDVIDKIGLNLPLQLIERKTT